MSGVLQFRGWMHPQYFFFLKIGKKMEFGGLLEWRILWDTQRHFPFPLELL